jgi:hypothetical protein
MGGSSGKSREGGEMAGEMTEIWPVKIGGYRAF